MANWFTRRRLERLVAAALYDDISQNERCALERAEAHDDRLLKLHDGLRTVREQIPKVAIEPPVDILPLIHARLGEPRRAPSTPSTRRMAFRAAVGVAGLVIAITGVWMVAGPSRAPQPVPGASSAKAGTSPIEVAMAESERLLAKQDSAAAYDVLAEAVSRQPRHALAGEAQYRLARIAFDMKRYPEALEAHAKLIGEYGDWLAESKARDREVKERRELLAEAKSTDFASLHEFNAAMSDRVDRFARLEDVVDRYQNQFIVANLAATEMAKWVAGESGADFDTGPGRLAALKSARERCTAPVAAALLELKIGNAYRDDIGDFTSAEEHYREAEKNPALAARAKDALSELAALRPRRLGR